MAVHEIIKAMDEYIAQLKAARILLKASLDSPLRSTKQVAKIVSRKHAQSSARTEAVTLPPAPPQVQVRVIPPKLPRQPRARKSSSPPAEAVAASSIPLGPVIVRANELQKKSPASIQKRSSHVLNKDQVAVDPLSELAQEVKRRLAANYK